MKVLAATALFASLQRDITLQTLNPADNLRANNREIIEHFC